MIWNLILLCFLASPLPETLLTYLYTQPAYLYNCTCAPATAFAYLHQHETNIPFTVADEYKRHFNITKNNKGRTGI